MLLVIVTRFNDHDEEIYIDFFQYTSPLGKHFNFTASGVCLISERRRVLSDATEAPAILIGGS